MAEQVLMPKQGNTVESCIILEWKKQEGETIDEGDIICEAETDKATIEVESTASGTILKQLYAVDDEAPVQSPIAIVGEPGEDISDLAGGDTAESSVGNSKEAAETSDDEGVTADKTAADKRTAYAAEETDTTVSVKAAGASEGAQASTGVSPRARNSAEKNGIQAAELEGSGPHGRVIERDVKKAAAAGEPLTPAAREKMAAQGLQAPEKGSGIGGRVRAADLAAGSPAAAAAIGQSAGERASEAGESLHRELNFPGPINEVPVRSIRKITAQRMYESIQSTCQLTLTSSAAAEKLLNLRKRFKESDEILGMQKVTINDMILFAAARTLKQFPYVNSHFLGDKIVEFEHVHLGCAVDAPKGLMVPVVPFADLRSLRNLSDEVKSLIAASQEGKLSPDKLEGGTFTVTNLGGLGIEHFTPVLNTPETAILGVNTIEQRPVQTDDGIKMKPYIGLSLTFDHQAFDGAPAARFLQGLVRTIEQIDVAVGA
ncbi:MAG: 2-oxo acid dehydrogenase subunit E2 [Spirochaetales bacterium]|nr:2-oxo acid dehydrogenase subunit E2 [Spirochaetales bacterium]